VNSGIEHIINQKYGNAEAAFIRLKESYPELPLSDIYLAAVEIAKSYDLSEPFNEVLINKYLEQAKKLTYRLIETNPGNAWHYYFAALTEGYYAYFKGLQGELFSAIINGVEAVSKFEKCISIDRNFSEAYAAIGTFKYWKSKKLGFLTWLPFIEDEQELGISLLRLAVRKSTYNKYLAMYSLIWIYIDREEFNKAFNLAKEASSQYPESRLFKKSLARVYEEFDIKKAIGLYWQVIKSLPEDNNRYDEIETKHIIAQLYVRIGEKDKAREILSEIISIENLTPYVKDKLKERMKRVKELFLELSG
jgi:tetratricopeptide (TPR) repeat protein